MISLLPVSASTAAVTVDRIFFGLLVVAGLTTILVFVLVITFAIRYRRGSAAARGPLPTLVNREFEVGWTVATAFLFVFLFWWAASSEISVQLPPADALEVHVVAKQWMWKLQHPSGAREIDELHVPIDRAVRLLMNSEDVIHSFFVPAFRIKQDVVPGTTTRLWFQATKVGVFPLLCAEYCGTDHSAMRGRIVVMRPEEYAAWSAAQPDGDDLAHEGAKLFVARGCAGCHAPSSTVHAPRLTGLFGRSIPLADGRIVVADAAYIRDSILQPRRDIAAGFGPIMPSFAGLVSESEVLSLTAYIKTLAGDAAPDPSR